MATTHLRHIALTVEERDPGCFTWRLLESTGDAVVYDVEVAASQGPFTSYSEALRRGCEQLLSMADSKAAGPRAAGEDETLDPVTEGGDVGAQHCR